VAGEQVNSFLLVDMCRVTFRPLMGDRLAVLFAKEPRAGEVKTRLSPPLTPAQAVSCHKAFVADSARRLGHLGGAQGAIAATPDGDAPWLAQLASEHGLNLLWQGDGELGGRMQRVLRAGCDGGRRVVILGADVPDLPIASVSAAFEALAAPGVVVGPATDGGYYLIGCHGPVPPVFDLDAGWGTGVVLAETVARLRAAGVRFELLSPWSDVDDHASLRALAARGATGADSQTRLLLRRLAREGVAL